MASPVEVIDDPQVVANGYLASHPAHNRARLAAGPCQFDGEQLTVRRGAPGTGEHTDEILLELGLDAATVAELRAAGAVA